MKVIIKILSFVLVIAITITGSFSCASQEGAKSETLMPESGGVVEYKNLSVDIKPDTLSEKAKIKISVLKNPPQLVAGLDETGKERLTGLCQFVGEVYDVNLNKELTKPAGLTLQYSPDAIPQGFSEERLCVAYYDEEKGWQMVGSVVDPAKNTIYTELTHFCAVGLIIAIPLVAIPLILGLGLGLASNPVITGQSPKYLTPNAARIQNAVSSGTFVVDIVNKQLIIKGLTFRIKERLGGEQKYPEQMMQDPIGMCDDYSSLFGSLLIAAGYPLRVIAGSATYHVGDKTVSGGHQWVEVLIAGQMYYVDTFNANEKVTLIPIAKARAELQLKPGLMWGKAQDDTEIKSQKYDPLWAFIGEWKLTRTSIAPKLPVPDLIIDRVVDSKATWTLKRGADGKLAFDYDGKKQWFNTLGQDFKQGITIIDEAEGSAWLTIDGEGSLYLEKLPTLFNFALSVGSENKKMEQITLNYQDEVKFLVTPENKYQITIYGEASGKYLAIREQLNPATNQKEEYTIWKNIQKTEVRIEYEAVREE